MTFLNSGFINFILRIRGYGCCEFRNTDKCDILLDIFKQLYFKIYSKILRMKEKPCDIVVFENISRIVVLNLSPNPAITMARAAASCAVRFDKTSIRAQH